MEQDLMMRYPIDVAKLIAKKLRIKRELNNQLVNPIEKRIAVLGGSTTNEIVAQLELFLLSYGIKAEFYHSDYNQYWQDAVFGNEELNKFRPDIIYIHTTWRNIFCFPSITDDLDKVDSCYLEMTAHLENAWQAIEKRYGCPIIQNNFERPNYRLLGNRDIWDSHGRSAFIQRLNQFIYKYAETHKNFYVNDIEYISSDYGITKWNNTFHWNMYKYAMDINAIPLVAQSVANIIKSLYGKNKKALILDLDNTLWGGIIGDDGQEGIAIGPETPEGQVYAEFQSYCKALKDLGIVLAVNSKNEEENALLGLNHPSGILKPDDFVAIKANWQPKDLNIIKLAEELNLGADSFVFIDDNPSERNIVNIGVPGVITPDTNNVEKFIEYLDHGGYFETTIISEEDFKKTQMYRENSQRQQLLNTCSNYDDYLQSLEMVASIVPIDNVSVSRVSQLTNKSNQFNLTTLRCSEEDIKNMQASEKYITLQGSLVDKFGDNGIVSVVIGKINNEELHINLWLMSCRVLKRGMEDAMMNVLVEFAKNKNIKKIFGYYYPTSKNKMVKDFYSSFNFKLLKLNDDGSKVWSLNLEKYITKDVHIKLKGE